MKFVKQQAVKAVLGVALVCAFALPAAAQEMKIGFVNLAELIDKAPQTKVAMEAMEEDFAPRQREFMAKQKEYQDLAAKVEKDFAVMGETERRNAQKDAREMERELTRLQKEFQEDANLSRNEIYVDLQQAMAKEVRAFAVSQGYDLIIGDGVLFVDDVTNITDEVLRAVEANYQASGAP